jgi:hypothetical protein
MGFIKTNYKVEDIGITLPNAYAQIIRLSADKEGRVSSIFAIQQTREDIANKENIDTISYRCEIDKDLPIYRQVYEKAKIDIFTDWEDDIVED